MAGTDTYRRAGSWLVTLFGVGLLLSGCSGEECLSGPSCDGDVTGTISGTVTAGTTGVASVVVTVSDGSTATTGSTGAYSIPDVPVGTHTVTITQLPPTVFCGATSRSVTISSAALQATADFVCEYLDDGIPVGR